MGTVQIKNGPLNSGPIKNHMDAMRAIREASVLYIQGDNVETIAEKLMKFEISKEAAVVAAVAGSILAKDFKPKEKYCIGDRVKIRTDGNVEGIIISERNGKPLPAPIRPELHWILTEKNELTQWDEAQMQKSNW